MKPAALSSLLFVAFVAFPLAVAADDAPRRFNAQIAQPVPQHDQNTPVERIALLEAKVQQQQAQIADLAQKLVELRDQMSGQIKAAQASANQAYGTAAAAQATAAKAQAELDDRAPKWDAVAGSYWTHKHAYTKTVVNYHMCSELPCSQIFGTSASNLDSGPPQ